MYIVIATVGIEKGIHARPSAKIVEYTLSKSDTYVEIEFPEESATANAKSVMGLLMLGVPFGKTVVIRAEGKDEKEVAHYIANIIKTFQV